MPARVAWITVAPVKGLALAGREAVTLAETGVIENRRFYLIDAQGSLVNGKRLGALLQASAEWEPEGEVLRLRLPDGVDLAAPIELGERVATVFYGRRTVAGHLVEGPFAEALSQLAGEPLRIVRPDLAGDANDRGTEAGATILGVASLARLAEAAGVATVDPRRFRMLFGVECIEPHAEDAWLGSRVRLGEAVVAPRGNVGRCVVTTRDPQTGARDLDTLEALSSYRREVDTTEPLPFGVWASVVTPGRVRVGDPVSVA